MTEAEWLGCADPAAMVRYLADLAASTDPRLAQPGDGWMSKRMEEERGRKYDRQLRLFACACARRLWPLLGEWGRRAVETSERYADGLAGPVELLAANHQRSLRESASWHVPPPERGRAARRARAAAQARRLAAQATGVGGAGDAAAWQVLLYAPVAVKRAHLTPGIPAQATAVERQAQVAVLREVIGNPFRNIPVDPAWLAWNAGTVKRLAEDAYEPRLLPMGYLIPHRLAVLADALEEAGCAEPDLLRHLRDPGPHCRGCWALDRLLNRL